MHAQALEVLPALLAALGIERPWLFGHSDGASIALLHASRRPTAGVVVVAPHLLVEDVSVASIAEARAALWPRATCGRGSPATTPILTRRFAAGAMPG